MERMGTAEVLSVLGQMELDLTQLIAQKRGLANVREVLTMFQEATASLASLQERHGELEKQIAALQSEFEAKRAAERKLLDKERAACAAECAESHRAMTEAHQKLDLLQQQVDEKEKFVAERSAQLESELKSKTAELTRVTHAFDLFRKEHGLAG
jgi:chromosome segregation ATPase